MEADVNTLTLSERLSKEILFKEESRLLQEIWGKSADGNDLEYLFNQLQKLKTLSMTLEQPWDRYIPLLFRSFACYMKFPQENMSYRKTYQLTAQLMDCVTFLSQNGFLIHSLSIFLNRQITELSALMGKESDKAK